MLSVLLGQILQTKLTVSFYFELMFTDACRKYVVATQRSLSRDLPSVFNRAFRISSELNERRF